MVTNVIISAKTQHISEFSLKLNKSVSNRNKKRTDIFFLQSVKAFLRKTPIVANKKNAEVSIFSKLK